MGVGMHRIRQELGVLEGVAQKAEGEERSARKKKNKGERW